MVHKNYEYTKILSNGDVIHGNKGKYLTQDQKDRVNEIISRAWDALTEEERKEVNKKIELKYKKEAVI